MTGSESNLAHEQCAVLPTSNALRATTVENWQIP